MKTKEQIEFKIEQVVQKRLKQRKDKYLSNNCKNCIHFCEKKICDNEVNYCNDISFFKKNNCSILEDLNKDCKFFSCKTTEEEVEREFLKDLSDPCVCGIKEPKLAVLIWVLREEEEMVEENDVEKTKEAGIYREYPTHGFVYWVKRIYKKFFGAK